ncbi:MAG: hypothetical protein JW983_03715 [Elusimicrobia bacterium]|nr:hypothetical protein [Elusimicrobiota bacterium]
MRKLSVTLIGISAVTAVIGGISRLTLVPLVTESRVYAGITAILLLFAIALNTLEKK